MNRAGATTGTSNVRYKTSDSSASSRSDYNAASGTLTFAPGETSKSFRVFINDDVYVETNETFNLTLSAARNATLGSPSAASVTIIDNDKTPLTSTASTSNPLDSPSFFVRQHYVDFFNREPDSSGLAFWTNQIAACGSDRACAERKRVNVLEAFYLSIEFQQTGFLVYRTHAIAFGQNRFGPSVPVTLDQFQSDAQFMGSDVVVNAPGWQDALEANKVAFFDDVVSRPEFIAVHPLSGSNADFIDGLTAEAQGAISSSERSQLLTGLNNGTKSRAQVLRAIVEDPDFVNAEMNKGFVLLEYFGYLRRNPWEFPDGNLDGYNFWLSKLTIFNGNFVNAEMVKAFIDSTEYRLRFGP